MALRTRIEHWKQAEIKVMKKSKWQAVDPFQPQGMETKV